MPPPLELDIFVAGKRPALNGQTIEITEADLDDVVASYDPKQFRAPLIVNRDLSHKTNGHSDFSLADAPICHGIPSALKRVGKTLRATFEKHTPELRRWIDEGRIPGLSASFYLPDSPSNPYPGQWALRHVAAVIRPAVKGMPLPGFSEATGFGSIAEFGLGDDSGFLEFSCACGGASVPPSPAPQFPNYGGAMHPNTPTLEGVLRPLRDYFIEQGGVELANRILPEHLFRSIDMMHAEKYNSLDGLIEELGEMLAAKDVEIGELRLQVSMLSQQHASVEGRCEMINSRIDGLVSEITGDEEEDAFVADPYSESYSSYSEPIAATQTTRSSGTDGWVSCRAKNTQAIHFLKQQAHG